MHSELDYKILMTFGGGQYISLNSSYRVAKHAQKTLDIKKYKHIIHKMLAYGWISGEKHGLPVFCYAAKFGITAKGSKALEYYKQVRYHHTRKKHLLSKEGRAMITLPGQRYTDNVYTKEIS